MDEFHQTNWNMALGFLQRLDKRLDERDIARNVSELQAWFNAISTIYSNIHFRVLEEDISQKTNLCKDIEQRLKDIQKMLNSAFSSNMNDKGMMSMIEEELKKVDFIINDILYTHDFLGMKRIERDKKKMFAL